MDSDSSELYHVEVETYDVFEAGKVTPAKSFEMIVHPVSCKILDSAEKAVDNIEIRDFVLELEDQEIKIEAFEKLIFGMFQSRTKLPERAESSVTMADNESMFSFGTFKTSMTPASRIPKQQFGTDSSVIITDQKLPTPQLRSQMDTPLRDNLENEKPKTGKIAEIEKKLQVIQEESGSPLKPQSKPEKFIMLQNVLREIQKEQPHQKIADQTRKFIEDDKKKQMDLAENKENFQKDRSNNQANICKKADPQKMAENVVEIIDLISQDPIENAVNRKSEDLFSTDPQVFPRTKTQTTDAQANPTKSRETDKIFVKQEEISAELGETGNTNQNEGGNLRNPGECRENAGGSQENPGDSREIPAKQGTPNDPRRNGGNFEEIAETRGSQRVATQIEADIRNLREIQENASVLKQNNQRELRKKPEMKIHEQDNTKQPTENRIFSQPKPTARRSARRKPVKIDEYSFDDTDDDLELQPFRSKRTMSEEKEEIPAKRARKTEDTTKNKRASKTKNCNENISSFIVPKRPARKQTKTQTKNEKVEKTDANGKKSVTMVKTSKKSTIKRGFSDLSSLGSGYEDAGKRNTVNYRRQSVTKVEYEIEEFDDAAEPRSAGNGMTLTGGSKKTGGIKNIAQNSAKIPKITTRSPKMSSKQGRIIGIPKNPRTPANVPKSSNIASKTPGLRQENTVTPTSPMQLNSKTQEHHQEARKRPANEDFAVPGPSGYRPPTKIHRSCNIEKETAVPASKNRDGFQKHEILKQNFVASSSVPGVRYNLNALEKNPLLRTFLDSVASQDPQNNTDLYGSEDFGQCETGNQENEEARGKIPERKNPPEKQVIEHDIPQHTYTIQKYFVPQMKAPAPEPVEPTKNVQVMDVEPENPPEICDSLQHTYTIQKNFEPQMNVPVEPTKNVRFTEKIEIVSDKTGHTIQYKKTAEYSSEESGFGMIKGLKRAEGERFPAIDQYKEELKESYLQILEQNEAKLKSIELNPEQFQIAQIQEKFKNFLNLQKSLNIEIPIFIDMLKHLQAQRQKVIVMKEKQTVILNDLLKMKMQNLEVLKSLAKKFNETIDISIEDGQKALDEAQKKIWKNFMVQAFAKLSEEVAKYY